MAVFVTVSENILLLILTKFEESWSLLTKGPGYIFRQSVNLKHSPLLTRMFTFEPASQFVEGYHSPVSCALNMEGLVSNNYCKFSKY
jgi:hypothetical protein